MTRHAEMDPEFAVALRSVLTEQVRNSRSMKRPRRRRLAKGLTTAFVVVGATAGIAAASDSVKEAFGWSQTHGKLAAKYSTAELLLTTTGPDGGPMQLYAADNKSSGKCYSVIRPQYTPHLADAECFSARGEQLQAPSRLSMGSGTDGPYGAIFVIHAPRASYVTVSDGSTTRRMPAAAGVSVGWIPPNDRGRKLTLTSYNSAGDLLETATAEVLPMRLPPGGTPPPCVTAPHGCP